MSPLEVHEVDGFAELAQRLGSSAARRALLVRFFALRHTLRDAGFITGFMWIDGSFAEDVETHRGTPPRDIDVVFFTRAPADCDSPHKERERMSANPQIFDRAHRKQQFHCDFFVVNLGKAPKVLVADTRYWYGLFSHRRGDLVWKGMLEVSMDSDDAEASAMLDNRMSTTQGDDHVAAA